MNDLSFNSTKIKVTRSKLLNSVGCVKPTSQSLQILVNQIETLTGKDISFNTIRRFFGLLDPTQPSQKTWSIINEYLISSAGITPIAKVNYIEHWRPIHTMHLLLSEKRSDDIIVLLKQTRHQDSYPILLGTLTTQLLVSKDLEFLERIYTHTPLFIDNYDEGIYCAELICSHIKQMTTEEIKFFEPIFSLHYFKETVWYFHIDYSYLNGYYGYLLSNFTADSEGEKLFLECILKYKLFLNGEPILPIEKKTIAYLEPLYPVLTGRYIGYQLLQSPQQADKIIDQLIVPIAQNTQPHYLFVEIFPALLINKDFRSIQKLIDKYYESLYEIEHWYSYIAYNIYLISESLLYIYEKSPSKAEIIFSSIDLETTGTSYYNYTRIFYLILKYQLSTDSDKKEVLMEYTQLVDKLGFKRFDTPFIQNYFYW